MITAVRVRLRVALVICEAEPGYEQRVIAGRDARLGGEGVCGEPMLTYAIVRLPGREHEFTADIKMGSFPYRACVVA
jgi:hypothetical protein